MPETILKDQSEVIAFLSDPNSYSAGPRNVDLIETHGALVFLAGDEVYKIKRAVKFPYMDFSTLERRERVVRREVEINKKLAPKIYLGVVPITREGTGELAFGGGGGAVEWAVHMRRFDESNILLQRVRVGDITDALIQKLAAVIAYSHDEARLARKPDGVAGMAKIIDELDQAFAAAPDIIAPRGCEAFARLAREHLADADHCLRLRAERGYIRRCHGDLHLRNIVVIDGEPVLFDAIEFDEELATIDTLYDLAFLLMDLMQEGARPAANLTLNRYLYHSSTSANLYGLKALPLFLACRSAIRAMIAIDRVRQISIDARAGEIENAASYFRAAQNYLKLETPELIAVGGFSGTGKSTLAAALAPSIGQAPGAVHLRSDLERKAMFDVAETTRLEPKRYSLDINSRVYDFLYQKALICLKAGYSVIVDAVFSRNDERSAIEDVAMTLKVPFRGLWLTASEGQLKSRVTQRIADASDATPEVVDQQIKRGKRRDLVVLHRCERNRIGHPL